MIYLKWLKETVKFLINDIKTDIEFIRKVFKSVKTGEKFWTPEKKAQYQDDLKKLTVKDVLMQLWPLVLIGSLAFFVGYFTAGQRYEAACNHYILDEFWQNDILTICDLRYGNISEFEYDKYKDRPLRESRQMGKSYEEKLDEMDRLLANVT